MNRMPQSQSEVLGIVRWCQENLQPGLASDVLAGSLSDARNGEEGLALESLVDVLFENEVVVPQLVLDRIAASARAMGLQGRLWHVLRLLSELGSRGA